jgi:UDP-2,3-diacylglucosamine hydrolase
VLPTPCHIISDTHLGVTRPETERSFEKYLRALPADARSLVINGDLFDFWFEWKTVIPRRGFRALAALADAHDAGVRILWLAGNHDCWGGEILRQDVGAEYQLGDWEGQIGPWTVRFEHGDGLREVEDRRYRMVRPIMRSPLAIKLFRRLHPDFATRIATGSSHASRSYGARDEGRGLRAIGHERLRANPKLDLLVFGHSHVAALERVPGAGIFANAGSWLDAPTFLRLTDDRVELREWTGQSAEGNCLNAIDRGAEEALADA